MRAESRKVGEIEVTTLSDGVLATSLDGVLGVDKAEAERLSGTQAGDPMHIAVNAFLVKVRGKLGLGGTGSGNTIGPAIGKLLERLVALGLGPGAEEVIPRHDV